jgi:adenylosuccinate synthase
MALETLQAIQDLQELVYSDNSQYDFPKQLTPTSQTREHAVSIEDCLFGDSGKARITQTMNDILRKVDSSGEIYSYTFNGGRNAGHEIEVNGVRIALHLLPVAVAQEGATAIIGKGKVVHPQDLVTEISYAEDKLGGRLWGKLLVDKRAVISDDLHAAFEGFSNRLLHVGHGSTKSGIAQGYTSYLEKRGLTIDDVVSDTWEEKFRKNYSFYATLMGGEAEMSKILVKRFTREGIRMDKPIGSMNEYIDELEHTRKELKKYAVDIRLLLEEVWYHTTIPFTFEGSQGAGLDPYFGMYPDITASRPLARISIPDSTEGVITYEHIPTRLGVMKVPYMSSVGSRIPPYSMDQDIADMYRDQNEERGKSTGRDRGIYPIDLVAMRVLQRASGYSHVAVTHMDSPHKDIPIEIVVDYKDKDTGKLVPYRPYQSEWDRVVGEVITLPSWDGKEVEHMRSYEELPIEAKQFLAFMSSTIAPVAMITNGRPLGNMISFLP